MSNMEVSHGWFHFHIFSTRKFAAANDKNHLNSTIDWIFYLFSYRFALYCTCARQHESKTIRTIAKPRLHISSARRSEVK